MYVDVSLSADRCRMYNIVNNVLLVHVVDDCIGC